MALSRVMQELLERDTSQLVDDLKAVRKAKADLEFEEMVLARLLSEKQAEQNGTAGDELPPASRSGAPNVSRTILELVLAEPDEWFDYQTVARLLGERDIRATRNTVRTALRRWEERGKLQTDGAQRYRAPQPERSPETADTENPFTRMAHE
jgi:hypothetical protein